MTASEPKAERRTLGWREWMALPDFGLRAIKVKLDSGARSSSLHVESLQEFERDGVTWLRFALDPLTRSGRKARWFEAQMIDRRKVTDSSGSSALRPFIRTRLAIAGEVFEIETNLTDRRGMLFPMLLGRTAMAGRIVVDPQQSYMLGEKPRRRRRKQEVNA